MENDTVRAVGSFAMACNTVMPPALQAPFITAPEPGAMRTAFALRNVSEGGQCVLIEFGKPPTPDTVTYLAPGQVLEFIAVVPQDDIYAACDIPGGRLVFAHTWNRQP